MTQAKTSTGRYKGACAQAQSRMRDLSNSFACTSDRATLEAMDAAAAACLKAVYEAQEASGYAELWTDGSWNQKAGAAGIGIVLARDGMEPAVFGKSVRAKGSEEAELYAMAIGLSYLLDTYPDIKSVRLRYDCASAAVNASNVDAYADRGAPYTNFRNAMKRCRKAGMTVLFQHAKAHSGIRYNETCDLLAKHYAKVPLTPAQARAVRPYIRTAAKKGGKHHG